MPKARPTHYCREVSKRLAPTVGMKGEGCEEGPSQEESEEDEEGEETDSEESFLDLLSLFEGRSTSTGGRVLPSSKRASSHSASSARKQQRASASQLIRKNSGRGKSREPEAQLLEPIIAKKVRVKENRRAPLKVLTTPGKGPPLFLDNDNWLQIRTSTRPSPKQQPHATSCVQKPTRRATARIRVLHSQEFKLNVVREALSRPPESRIKPTCRHYPGIEPCQLRKWITAHVRCEEQQGRGARMSTSGDPRLGRRG